MTAAASAAAVAAFAALLEPLTLCPALGRNVQTSAPPIIIAAMRMAMGTLRMAFFCGSSGSLGLVWYSWLYSRMFFSKLCGKYITIYMFGNSVMKALLKKQMKDVP